MFAFLALLAPVAGLVLPAQRVPAGHMAAPRTQQLKMITITDGVEFDTIAREWRMKWSGDDDKASLAKAQSVLSDMKSTLKAIPGVKSVQRVVCGGCLDFKVITALNADDFGAWEEKDFAPESDFLEKVKAIDGISQVETQTYTLMPVD
ncbi:hypothetical protein AB1Y20_008995 [Prymnesium parvum]|uniref:Stress-response A/B barrel domain-containing protein n=1 Tax=Prymnesium parvum TaxID=97485 RepID=A0AB34JZ42_PRYPA|mmetsp:Transcript_33275/g.58312  ORF Transcript_33275/g.58312 Transcript_33275/m.58312 type:complete len:149 (+) Transcript_33275:50-496(+)